MADELEDDFATSDVDNSADDVVTAPTKRSLEDGGSEEDNEAAKQARKKQKLKRKDKANKAKKAAANLAMKPGALARFPPDMQVDHLRKLMLSCRRYSKLTQIELDEFGLTEKILIDTSGSNIDRIAENLTAFIHKIAPEACKNALKVADGEKEYGRPYILMITGNAQRAADLSRSLRPLVHKAKSNDASSKQIAVAKLFAKHFKVAEQSEFLRSHICPVAVGTPQRLSDLLQHGLAVERLKCIVLDASWTDVKQRSMLDDIEIRQATFEFLASGSVQAGFRSSAQATKVVLF